VLPDKVEADRVGASLKNGVLTIRLPKSEQAKPKQIRVN
jgi:HSP20 family protein